LKLHEAFKIEDSNWADRYFLVTEPWADASLDRFFQDLDSSRDGTSSSCSWYLPGKLDPWPSIVNQCIAGIQHLHKNSIRHKDMKPSNILLVDESNNKKGILRVKVIIADLGISKATTVGAPTSFDGTKQYMAPEQIARKSSTTQSDIFSLGTCFAMIQAALCTKARVRSWMTAKQKEAGFFAVDKVAASRFAENIDIILNLLEQLCTEEEARAHPAKNHFHRTLQTMVQKMFIEDPVRRPTANELLAEYQISELQLSQDGKSRLVNVYISTGPRWRWSNLHRIMVPDSTSDDDFIHLVGLSI
jgi:serine/threonine protein kinase